MPRPFSRRAARFFAICLTAVSSQVFAAPQNQLTPPVMRLGDAVKPLAYDAELSIVPEADQFNGKITIDVELAKAQNFFWLNADKIDVKNARLMLGKEELDAKIVKTDKDFVGLQFARMLPAGKARLTLTYSGQFSKSNTSGLFKQKDGDHWYVFSQFESTTARRAFPCFDEPQWKTPWTLALTVKRDHVAVTNMPSIAEENVGSDMKRVRFAPTLPLPSYLIALGVGPFDVVDGGTAGMNKTALRYITPKGRAAEAAYAAKVTPQILQLLEDYFGRPYPYAKLDSMAIPITVNFGAMENAGLITYRANILLHPADREDERAQRRYVSIAAHEIAHQWFGDLVTMAWWNDLWLNESFATWMSRKATDQFNPDWNGQEQREDERITAIHTDRLASTRQIRQIIAKPDDLANAFDRITYDKGGAVLSMFESWLGEQRFRDGVRHYLHQHEYSNATAEDFFAAISESDAQLSQGFSSFVEQPGVPLISMALDCQAKPTLHLKQERYQPGSKASSVSQQLWNVPVCVRYEGQQSDQPFCTMLHEKEASIALPDAASCPGWLLPNPAGVGYFISKIDHSLLSRLHAVPLKTSEITALLNDLKMLAQAGEFSQDQLLELAANYAADARPEVVKAAVDAVHVVNSATLDSAGHAQFSAWVKRNFGPQALKLGWLKRDGDSEATNRLRADLLPLAANIGAEPTLRAQSRELARQWLNAKSGNGPEPQLGAMLGHILHSAAYSGDQVLFDMMAGTAAKARDNGYRNEVLSALGSFTDPTLRQKAMDLVLSGGFDPREAVSILYTASGNPDSTPAVQQFVQQHYAALLDRLPEGFGANLLHMGSALCSSEERNSFDRFNKTRAAKYPGGKRNFAQTLESIDICVMNRTTQQGGMQRFMAAAQ